MRSLFCIFAVVACCQCASLNRYEEGLRDDDTLILKGTGKYSGTGVLRTPLQREAAAYEVARTDARQRLAEIILGHKVRSCATSCGMNADFAEITARIRRIADDMFKIRAKIVSRSWSEEAGAVIYFEIRRKNMRQFLRDSEQAVSDYDYGFFCRVDP